MGERININIKRAPEWEPGSLTSMELRTVATDAIADLYADEYRQGRSQADQARIFAEKLTRYIQDATGLTLSVRP